MGRGEGGSGGVVAEKHDGGEVLKPVFCKGEGFHGGKHRISGSSLDFGV